MDINELKTFEEILSEMTEKMNNVIWEKQEGQENHFDTWNKAQQVCFVQMRAMVRSAYESVNGYISWFDK